MLGYAAWSLLPSDSTQTETDTQTYTNTSADIGKNTRNLLVVVALPLSQQAMQIAKIHIM